MSAATTDATSYTRKQHAASLPSAQEFLLLLNDCNPKGRDAYAAAREKIEKRFHRLSEIAAKTLAAQFKLGLSPFPSHFEFMTQSYELPLPSWLADASKKQLKSRAFFEEKLAALAPSARSGEDGEAGEAAPARERDRRADAFDEFVTFIIALTTAGKIPTHWAALPED